jgi:hypothetical protein
LASNRPLLATLDRMHGDSDGMHERRPELAEAMLL